MPHSSPTAELFVNPSSDGMIEYGMSNSAQVVKGTAHGRDAALFAARFLISARVSQEATGRGYPTGKEPDFKYISLPAQTIGIMPVKQGGDPNHSLLLLGFGDAQLAIAIDAPAARQLAQEIRERFGE